MERIMGISGLNMTYILGAFTELISNRTLMQIGQTKL